MSEENVPIVVEDKDVEIRDIVARALFNARWKLRKWDGANPYQKKLFVRLADDALRRAGVKNMTVRRSD